MHGVCVLRSACIAGAVSHVGMFNYCIYRDVEVKFVSWVLLYLKQQDAQENKNGILYGTFYTSFVFLWAKVYILVYLWKSALPAQM